MKLIASNFLGKCFGVATVIKVNDVGISINLTKGVEQNINIIQWTALLQPPRFSLGFFGQIISFKTADKHYVFSMLSFNILCNQQGDCERFWVTANIVRLDKLLTTINKIITYRYLRQSSIEQIQHAASTESQRWFSWLNATKLSTTKSLNSLSDLGASITKKLRLLSSYQQWSQQDIAACRDRYITKQLNTYKVFFDRVESKPLTLSQRIACIIDNDNNLLLAGAGTGKTSVMVGRAGYLLHSSQAQSHEILLLAYGRQAADEMDERIKVKLSDHLTISQVKTSTFHGVGLNIITQVEGKQPRLSIFAQNEQAKRQWVSCYFEKLINEQPSYCTLVVDYLNEYHNNHFEQSCFDLQHSQVKVLVKTLTKLVGLYKAACVNDADTSMNDSVNALISDLVDKSTEAKQNQKVLTLSIALLKPILIAYQHQLALHDEIDFEDMINKALTYVKTGQFTSPWRYIMVDEFQDMSEPRARLVKALRDNNKDCSVFAVGDDWQAIYRFSGADINLTTNFAQYFGATTQSVLDLTFRFNNHIGKIATDFISKNPAQINKNIKSIKQVNAPAVILLNQENNQHKKLKPTVINDMANGAIDKVLSTISAQVAKAITPVTVYLLARFSFLLLDKSTLKQLNKQYPLLNIECHTFHACKGKEAEYVILIGLTKGTYGFPTEKNTSELLETLTEVLLAKKESFAYAEERRLFYVALTRAKDKVYIIADMSAASPFVNELIDEHAIDINQFEQDIELNNCEKLTKL